MRLGSQGAQTLPVFHKVRSLHKSINFAVNESYDVKQADQSLLSSTETGAYQILAMMYVVVEIHASTAQYNSCAN